MALSSALELVLALSAALELERQPALAQFSWLREV